MLIGMALGFAHIPFPLVEEGILLSVCAFGVLIALLVRMPTWTTALIAGFFALFHGYACGADLPDDWASTLSGSAYAGGLILCTASLIAAGFGLGKHLNRLLSEKGLRISGACILAAGIYIVVAGYFH